MLKLDSVKGHLFLKKRIALSNLDLTKFNSNPQIRPGNIQNIEDVLVKGSSYCRHRLKKRLLKKGLLKNICYICGLLNYWNNKVIVLQLDHINGVNDDNRIENLRILCPNCHSQTSTFCGRNNLVNNKVKSILQTDNVKANSDILNRYKFIVTKETLEDLVLVKKLPMTKIGKQFGVSDNAIRKRCDKFKIDWRNRKNH